MAENQTRKAINVSLQSKKYTESINEIINEWENQDLNISAETCDALLLVHRLKKFSSLSNIFNILKMLDNLSSIYHYDDTQIDTMLNQIIDIDNERFSQILIELNNLEFVSTDNLKLKEREKIKKKDFDQESKEMNQEKTIEENKIVEEKKEEKTEKVLEQKNKNKEIIKEKKKEKNKVSSKKIKEEVVEEKKEEMVEVPMDFLLNS